MPPQEHSVFWWKKQINCFLWYWTQRVLFCWFSSHADSITDIEPECLLWQKSKSLSLLAEKMGHGEGGCCVHLTEHFKVFFSSLLLSPFYPRALIFLLIFLLTESTYSTCKCENQCLHNLKQLKLIKANHHLPGWIEVESSLCPNSHTPLQTPACHTAGENGKKFRIKSECQPRGSSATTLLLCAVISAVTTELSPH